MKKRVLILGAKGNLGVQLERVFRDGYDVTAWDKGEIDITDRGLVEKKITDVKPHIIINAASYNAVDKCEEDDCFEIAKRLNGTAVGYLADAALKNKAVLIHYSTDYVFSGNQRKGYLETDKPDPVNRYGESKLLGEQELIKRSGKGLKWYLIRTQKLFGPRGSSEAAKPSFFDIMTKLSEEREIIEAVDSESGSFTYTPDLAAATRKMIEGDYGFGIYHLTNTGKATWYKAAKILFRIQGNKKIKLVPVESEHFPRPALRPKSVFLLNTKFEHMRSWEEALREYLL
jgi:dTDP-4-dehydrorhamnose reductase